MKLIVDNVWADILKLWVFEPRCVAVPYFSCDEGIFWGSNDVLIVDASEDKIAARQTVAAALRRAFQAGAAIYSCDKPHAKLYVLGDKIVIGSANSSINSRNTLIESVIVSDNPHLVAEGASFVDALIKQSQPVDEAFLARIEKIDVKRALSKTSKRTTLIKLDSPRCWLVGIHSVAYPGDNDFVENENATISRQKAYENDEIDWFWWRNDGKKFSKEAKVGDLIIEIYSDLKKTVVYRHGRIVKITEEANVNAKVYHIVWPCNTEVTKLKWNEFSKFMVKIGWNISLSKNSCREVPLTKSLAIAEFWPKSS